MSLGVGNPPVSVRVYVTDSGTHKIPDDVWEEASRLVASTKWRNVNDRRTRAHRYLSEWAKEQDGKDYGGT